MNTSIERIVAEWVNHQDRVAKVLARSGEVIHPDHYDIREAVRLAVLHAIDGVSANLDAPKMSDGELPNLFRALDAIAERMFLRQKGL